MASKKGGSDEGKIGSLVQGNREKEKIGERENTQRRTNQDTLLVCLKTTRIKRRERNGERVHVTTIAPDTL